MLDGGPLEDAASLARAQQAVHEKLTRDAPEQPSATSEQHRPTR